MTFLTKKSLARRTMLKGLGAGIALPMLDAMMPALSAQTKKAPPRLGFVYASHGIIHSQWKPTQTGKNFALSANLKPLEGLRDHINVLTNLSHLEADTKGDGSGRLAHRRSRVRSHPSRRGDPSGHYRRSNRSQASGPRYAGPVG